MLIDSGADVSFLPRQPIADIIDKSQQSDQYEVEAFDGTRSRAAVAELEVLFLGKSFSGQFLLLDAPYGYLDRNILNNISLRQLKASGSALYGRHPKRVNRRQS